MVDNVKKGVVGYSRTQWVENIKKGVVGHSRTQWVNNIKKGVVGPSRTNGWTKKIKGWHNTVGHSGRKI